MASCIRPKHLCVGMQGSSRTLSTPTVGSLDLGSRHSTGIFYQSLLGHYETDLVLVHGDEHSLDRAVFKHVIMRFHHLYTTVKEAEGGNEG